MVPFKHFIRSLVSNSISRSDGVWLSVSGLDHGFAGLSLKRGRRWQPIWHQRTTSSQIRNLAFMVDRFTRGCTGLAYEVSHLGSVIKIRWNVDWRAWVVPSAILHIETLERLAMWRDIKWTSCASREKKNKKIYMYIYIHIHIYTHIYTYLYEHIHTHACIYTHM